MVEEEEEIASVPARANGRAGTAADTFAGAGAKQPANGGPATKCSVHSDGFQSACLWQLVLTVSFASIVTFSIASVGTSAMHARRIELAMLS